MTEDPERNSQKEVENWQSVPSGPGSGENCGSLSTMEIESCDERNPTMSDFKPF